MQNENKCFTILLKKIASIIVTLNYDILKLRIKCIKYYTIYNAYTIKSIPKINFTTPIAKKNMNISINCSIFGS